MNEFARGDIEFWNNKVFINNTELLGVKNLTYSVDSTLNNFNYLGMNSSPMIFTNSIIGNLNINKELWDKDYLWSFTGSSGLNFSLLIDKNDLTQYVGFISGYLTNYSLNFEVGRIPQVSANISAFGPNGDLNVSGFAGLLDNINKIRTTNDKFVFAGYSQIINQGFNFNYLSGENPRNYFNTGDFAMISGTLGSNLTCSGLVTGITNTFIVLNQTGFANASGNVYKWKQFNQVSSNSLELSLDEFNTNRVKSASFSAEIQRLPIYYLNQKYPTDVLTPNFPKITCQFEFDVDTLTLQNYDLFPTGVLKQQNISFDVKTYTGNKSVMRYEFPNMILVSESYSVETEGITKANLVYSNYLI